MQKNSYKQNNFQMTIQAVESKRKLDYQIIWNFYYTLATFHNQIINSFSESLKNLIVELVGAPISRVWQAETRTH